MGNRFSTLSQYHQLVLGHGILAVITFLFVVPAAVMHARFRPYGSSNRLHAYLQVFAVGLCTVVFVLGWFAVGPNRSLTNPHHGIGVAIYTMILVQLVGGRLVKNIRKKSFRLMLHRWLGRSVAILGIVQIPLGLTLYGSPKYTFILYAIWMAFLLLVYFILSWRHESNRDREVLIHGGRSEGDITASDDKPKHKRGWLGPLLAGAGIWALLRGRKNHENDRDRSDVRSRPSSRSRIPEVIPSRRGSDSYMEDEKVSGRTERRGGGAMNWLLGLAGLVGAGALVKGVRDKRERRRYDDEEYSAVATDTPSRFSRPNRTRKPVPAYTESEFSDDRTEIHGGARTHTPLLPGPGNPADTATIMSSVAPRPVTPRQSHARPPIGAESSFVSDYSSYVSPSRRPVEEEKKSKAGKGILAAIGLGWLAKRMKDRHDQQDDEERRRLEDERRDGHHGSRYTGDGYSTPTRSSRRRPPPASAPTATSLTYDSGSSMLESRPPGTSVGPPMPPLGAAGARPPVPVPVPAPGSRPHSHSHSHSQSHSHSRSRSRSTRGPVTDPVSMPPMPPDPRGVLHTLRPESGSESFASSGGRTHRRHSSRHRKEREGVAAVPAPSTLGPATEDEDRRRDRSQAPSGPVSVKVRYHDDRDKKITLRRLTEEEAAKARRGQGARSDSVSSISDSEAPASRRRYRRDSSSQRTAEEATAERLVSEPLSPPTPAFAKGRRAGKDSAYYSGQPGPSGSTPMAGQTVSSIGTESHEAWSAMSPSPSGPAAAAGSSVPSAADRRRRRRLERRDQRPSTNTVEFS